MFTITDMKNGGENSSGQGLLPTIARIIHRDKSNVRLSNPAENFSPQYQSVISQKLNFLENVLMSQQNSRVLEIDHFKMHAQTVRRSLSQLASSSEDAIARIQETIRVHLTHAMFAALMKKVPRYFVNQDGIVSDDKVSQHWSPGYSIIYNGWSKLTPKISDQDILDPFAGSGSFMIFLAAMGFPQSITMGDLAYPGGKPIQNDSFYNPTLNVEAWSEQFKTLPPWCQPRFNEIIRQQLTLNAQHLPFQDNSFDLTVTDPPYGVFLEKEKAGQFFIDTLPELQRVSRKGGIYLIPIKWLTLLQEKGIQFEQMTEDLSKGKSPTPTCFVYISKEVFPLI